MNPKRFLPAQALVPFINGYLIMESQTEFVNRILPDISLAVAFQFRGHVNYIVDNEISRLPVSSISGLRKSARLINYTANSSVLIVQFKPGGASAFFRTPMNELFGETTSLDNIIGYHRVEAICGMLAQAKDDSERIGVIEHFLLSQLSGKEPDKLISSAMQKICLLRGRIKIKHLANELYISQDAFEKRFRKIIGASPKQFSSIVRMNNIIRHQLSDQSLKNISYDAGFFDQSHFNKEFKLFTGQTPGDFLKSYVGW